jgi:protoheme ferro-lyase
VASFQALLFLSFGGPNGPDDVMPFLRNVTRGRGVPQERLEAVAEHYDHLGGISPINRQNRALMAALEADFAAHGIDLPIYWGNRNWKPYVADAVRRMRDDRVKRGLVFATSATASFSGCRQYRNDMAQARSMAGDGSPDLVKLRHYFDHPGFIAANVDHVQATIASLPPELRDSARLVFTAHSIPQAMNDLSGPGRDGLYLKQQYDTARLVAGAWRRCRLRPGLAVPLRAAAGAVARAGHQRSPEVPCRAGRAGRRRLPDRVRLRPRRGDLGPGQRGARDCCLTRPHLRARADRGHASRLRRRDP